MNFKHGLLLLVLCAPAFGVHSPSEKPITAAEALESIGKPQIVVEMIVQKSKDRLEKRGLIYLDSEEDFGNDNNLGIAISAGTAAKMRDSGIADPAAYFLGKRIRVSGCVMRFEERVYLPVLEPSQIAIVAADAPTETGDKR